MKEEVITIDQAAVDRAREDGYASGLAWKDSQNWTPGGPWIYRGMNKQLNAQSVAENKAWREGWAAGNAKRLEGR